MPQLEFLLDMLCTYDLLYVVWFSHVANLYDHTCDRWEPRPVEYTAPDEGIPIGMTREQV